MAPLGAIPMKSLGRVEEEMGLAPGGRMRQQIFEDPFELQDWDVRSANRCFVHICNSMTWSELTGQVPPYPPPTAKEYTRAHLPWFDFYDADARALEGSKRLAGLASVGQIDRTRPGSLLPGNAAVDPERIVVLRRGMGPIEVRQPRS